MDNKRVCRFVEKVKILEKNADEEKYVCQLCVEQGYGQTVGGYLASGKKSDLNQGASLQKEHFLSYYRGKVGVTYQYLRCPELLLFIAEIAGVPRDCLLSGYETLKRYEETNGWSGKEKSGNYIWGTPEFKEFKAQLRISDVVKIIKTSKNWKDVREKTKQFENNPRILPIADGVNSGSQAKPVRR